MARARHNLFPNPVGRPAMYTLEEAKQHAAEQRYKWLRDRRMWLRPIQDRLKRMKGCCRCGEHRDGCAMVFRSVRTGTVIGRYLPTLSKKRLHQELPNFDVLCVRCVIEIREGVTTP